MKNRILIGFMLLIGAFIHVGCDELETISINEDVVPNTLNALANTDIELTFDDAAEIVETFSWTNPDFGFEAGTVYSLEMDVAGNNFADAFELATTRMLTAAITVKAMNDGMLALV